MLNVSIFRPLGWFEITNTCSVFITQFEADNGDKQAAPVILLGGMIDQYTSTQQYNISSNSYNHRTSYIHVGSNACFKDFGNGTHSDGWYFTDHVPVSVTGGSFNGFYLSGVYRPDAQIQADDAEGYISGGYFKEMAGAAQQMIEGSVKWQIYDADIDNFYGGGINSEKPITGNVTVDIINSHVGTYCGGPKFGDMQKGGTTFTTQYSRNKAGSSVGTKNIAIAEDGIVSTNAVGCTFGNYNNDRGKYYDGKDNTYKSDYGNKGPGVATDFDYEFFVWSSGLVGARFYVNYTSFSLAQTNNVISKLNKCTVNENFYGGGSLGVVSGNATSELNDCIVKGSVYGGGFSASIPSIPVRATGFAEVPKYNKNSGIFEMGKKNGTTNFTWKEGTLTKNTIALDDSEILTDVNLDNLGAETLMGRGDCLFFSGSALIRLQGSFIEEKDVADICKQINNQDTKLGMYYLPVSKEQPLSVEDVKMIGEFTFKYADPLFKEAAKFVVENQMVSISMLQRKYSIGYTRAARITDILVVAKIITPFTMSFQSEVLIPDLDTLSNHIENIKKKMLDNYLKSM